MQGINHFILEVEKAFNDTIEVGDIELFIDKKISRDRAANRFGTIVNIPAQGKTILKKGYQVIFDATILYRQIYKEGVQESIHLVDKEKSWYKIEPDMIVLYRENDTAEWKGYGDNLMVSFITEKPNGIAFKKIWDDATSSVNPSDYLLDEACCSPLLDKPSIITSAPKETHVKGKAVVKYRNAFLEENHVENGQEIFINPTCGIPFFFKNETLYWIRTKDVLAA